MEGVFLLMLLQKNLIMKLTADDFWSLNCQALPPNFKLSIKQPIQDPYQQIPFQLNLLLELSSPRLILNSKLQVSVKSL